MSPPSRVKEKGKRLPFSDKSAGQGRRRPSLHPPSLGYAVRHSRFSIAVAYSLSFTSPRRRWGVRSRNGRKREKERKSKRRRKREKKREGGIVCLR
ncbi:hypothetical protein PUN28_002872 [Cardiocondyla obscurior]|uniref:Uncharacterized protein n=1 Tax=Cardiocondyla obscurior TaxID=286306 RepID=A0AAW2GWE2_9HYME